MGSMAASANKSFGICHLMLILWGSSSQPFWTLLSITSRSALTFQRITDFFIYQSHSLWKNIWHYGVITLNWSMLSFWNKWFIQYVENCCNDEYYENIVQETIVDIELLNDLNLPLTRQTGNIRFCLIGPKVYVKWPKYSKFWNKPLKNNFYKSSSF